MENILNTIKANWMYSMLAGMVVAYFVFKKRKTIGRRTGNVYRRVRSWRKKR
jgi:hypothetical protein